MVDRQTLVAVDVNAMATTRSMYRVTEEAESSPTDEYLVLAAASVAVLANTMKTVLNELGQM